MATDTHQLINEFSEKENVYHQFGDSMCSLLIRLINVSHISTHSIQHRVKDVKSLKAKVELKNKYNSLNEITDILGVRIITYYSNDIDEIEKIIKNSFVVDDENTIDKRKTYEPDRFGYMSLHYVVSLNPARATLEEYRDFIGMKFEIQIRTILQHTWAEIEHDLGYKTQNSVPNHIRRKFSILSGSLELIDGAFIDIRNSLTDYENEIKKIISDVNADEIITQENGSDLNSLYLKNFAMDSNEFDKLYQSYLSKENDKLPKSAPSSYVYPHKKKNEKQISYDFLVGLLEDLGIKNSNDLSQFIKSIGEDEKIISAILKFRSNYDDKYLSRYFFFLFATYCFIHREGLVDSLEKAKKVNIIQDLGDAYDSL